MGYPTPNTMDFKPGLVTTQANMDLIDLPCKILNITTTNSREEHDHYEQVQTHCGILEYGKNEDPSG